MGDVTDPPAPVACSACAAKGRRRWLVDPVSIALGMGPTCFRRTVTGNPAAVRGLQLALDFDVPPRRPRRRRRLAAA